MAGRPAPPHRRRRLGDEGTLTLFAAIVAIALLAVVAFVLDAAQKLEAGQQARDLAEEAARAGADAVNVQAAYAGSGPLAVSPAQAITAARQYLSQSGHAGTVIVTGTTTVQVTVTVTDPAPFTAVLGITSVSATETATATLTQGVTGPQGQP
jgi:Flp pilus assembly protein TadG